MGRLLIRRALLACGVGLLILFLGSIAYDLSRKKDEVCDWCGELMEYGYSIDSANCTFQIFECQCHQRGQKRLYVNGQIEWDEW